MRKIFGLTLCLLLASLSACALFPQRDPLNINVVGIEPLPSEDLEMRFAVTLEVNGRPLASGVSDQHGRIGRFSEGVLVVPVSVSAFSVLRQTLGLGQTQGFDNLPYVLRGKLAGGLFGTLRFVERGHLSLPDAANGDW
jgi:hypothetical protein